MDELTSTRSTHSHSANGNRTWLTDCPVLRPGSLEMSFVEFLEERAPERVWQGLGRATSDGFNWFNPRPGTKLLESPKMSHTWFTRMA